MMMRRAVLLLIAAAATALSQPLLYFNATVRTMDPSISFADAFVVVGDRFDAVGAYKEIALHYPDAITVDLGGLVVLPGLIDAHGHLTGEGFALMQVNLVGSTSVEGIFIA